jgi:hypothetical protein
VGGRGEHGGERERSDCLGAAVIAAGADRLHPAITCGSAELGELIGSTSSR